MKARTDFFCIPFSSLPVLCSACENSSLVQASEPYSVPLVTRSLNLLLSPRRSAMSDGLPPMTFASKSGHITVSNDFCRRQAFCLIFVGYLAKFESRPDSCRYPILCDNIKHLSLRYRNICQH
ncbi:hypothetical protein GGS21DRAFT_9394 [Xylaria nigripes]|nr:hypothetical protein GGS21DRAFT_9394 [Xylaria nigripes]